MGAQRCPMATDRTGIATEATCRWSWSSLTGYAGGAQWNLVGFGHGGTVARVAKEISAVRDLPSSLPAMGAEDKLERILRVLAEELHSRGKLEVEEAFIDASFTGAKKRGFAVRLTRRGKGAKIIACRWSQSSSRHSYRKRFATRKPTRRRSPRTDFPRHPSRTTDRGRSLDRDRLDRDLAQRYGTRRVFLSERRNIRLAASHQ